MRKNLTSEVDDCISHFHPEMYFAVLYLFISQKEYSLIDNIYQVDKDEVFAKWKKLSSLSFRIACQIEDKYFKSITRDEEKHMLNTYANVIDFGAGFDMAISMYFCFREDAEELIQNEFGEASFKENQMRYYEICMEKGKRIAENRIEKHLKSEEYFGLEFVDNSECPVWKIFLTPKGYLNKEKLIDFVESKTINKLIEEFMANNHFSKIEDSSFQSELNTSMIFKDLQSRVFYYQRRVIGPDGQSFNQQRTEVKNKSFLH